MAKVCCFVGHRRIVVTKELVKNVYFVVEHLIKNEQVDTFLFGSRSQFNDLCYEIVSELKREFFYIKRIYVRAEYPYIDEEYATYLLKRYEETYYSVSLLKAGRGVYVKRNCDLIDRSDFCVMYFDESYKPCHKSKSGTGLAFEYAKKKKKKCIQVFVTQNEKGETDF